MEDFFNKYKKTAMYIVIVLLLIQIGLSIYGIFHHKYFALWTLIVTLIINVPQWIYIHKK